MNYAIELLKEQKDALEWVVNSLKGSDKSKKNLADVNKALQLIQTSISGSFSYEDMKRAYLSGGCKEEWFEVTGDESVRLPDFEKWISTQKI